jgi:DNA-binding GntR family transcriptional regulator
MPMKKLDQVVADPALKERRTTSDYVADALRSAILSGQFADGEELNQVELAEHFGVSRVPIREALRRLQAEGLVKAQAHRRAVVQGFTPDRIAEIFEARGLLEGYMLEKAAQRLTDADLAEMRRAVERMDKVKSHEAWLTANRDFHLALWHASHDETVKGLIEQLTGQVERYLKRSGGFDRAGEANAEHRAILDALEAGQVKRAVKLLREHIASTGQVVRERMNGAADAADAAA